MISEYLVMLRDGKVIFFGKTTDLLERQRPTLVVKPEKEGDLERLRQLSEKLGHRATVSNGQLHIDAEVNWSAPFNRAAFESGITLASIAVVLPTLEETFFEMTSNQSGGQQ
jgi:ABC-type multidrug transport system ATPase subunit